MDELKEWFAANSYAELARRLGITPAAVAHWVYRDKVPADKVPLISKATKIPASKLRPDLFGKAARRVTLPGDNHP